MEQVDQIITVTLRDIGIDVRPEISSLKQFDTLLVVKSVSRCINLINGDTKMSEVLPMGMAGRYRVGIELADACKKLGYKADLGYETFLYSSDVEIRRLLMFLVEQLPRARQDSIEGVPTSSSSVSLLSSISSELKRQLKQPWLPPQCYKNNIIWDGNKKNGAFHYFGGFSPLGGKKLSHSDKSPMFFAQCSEKDLLPSLIELTTQLRLEQEIDSMSFLSKANSVDKERLDFAEAVKKTTSDMSKLSNEHINTTLAGLSDTQSDSNNKEHNLFKMTESIMYADEESVSKSDEVSREEEEDELRRKNEEEKKSLVQTIDKLEKKLDADKNKISNANRRLDDLQKKKKEVEDEIEQLKEEYILKKKTLKLVPDEGNALTAMKDNIKDANALYQTMQEQWTVKEVTMKNEFTAAETELKTKELQTSEFVEEIRFMRDEITSLVSSIESKDETLKSLQHDVENLPDDSITRSTHTSKILEIVARIKKQKAHINEIITETKTVQKDINTLNGKIERSFIETDEMIFRQAKENEMCRQAYKLLANLQSEFNALVRGLDEIGVINRELRHLEDLLQREKEKNIAAQIANMSKDLDAVVKDNEALKASIKDVQ